MTKPRDKANLSLSVYGPRSMEKGKKKIQVVRRALSHLSPTKVLPTASMAGMLTRYEVPLGLWVCAAH